MGRSQQLQQLRSEQPPSGCFSAGAALPIAGAHQGGAGRRNFSGAGACVRRTRLLYISRAAPPKHRLSRHRARLQDGHHEASPFAAASSGRFAPRANASMVSGPTAGRTDGSAGGPWSYIAWTGSGALEMSQEVQRVRASQHALCHPARSLTPVIREPMPELITLGSRDVFSPLIRWHPPIDARGS